jgi:hypothetical protein
MDSSDDDVKFSAEEEISLGNDLTGAVALMERG